MRIVAVTLAAVVIFFGVWVSMYPSASDPKNVGYVLWKAGLYKINLDIATGTMIGDAGRDKLVIGKTEAELRAKFEYLVPPNDASPYLGSCYQSSRWKDRKALFIRRSPWMVVFDREKATQLVLIKGC